MNSRTETMPESNEIRHEGVVVEQKENGKVVVRIVQQSACSACHARSMCMAAESKEKEVVAMAGDALEVGDKVSVVGSKEMGMKAVVWAFVLPFVLLFGTIIGLTVAGWEEWQVALLALGLLLPYALLLYLLRHRLEKQFVFRAEKLNGE